MMGRKCVYLFSLWLLYIVTYAEGNLADSEDDAEQPNMGNGIPCDPLNLIEGCLDDESANGVFEKTTDENGLPLDRVMPEAMVQQPLVCYEVQCNGKGCIHESLLQASNPAIDYSCTATTDQVCYVEIQETEAGVFLTAGCGVDCDWQPTTAKTTTHTWHGPTTEVFPRKRRKRSSIGPSKECCSSNYCNHDSPCGKLTCGAELTAFAKLLGFLAIAITYLL